MTEPPDQSLSPTAAPTPPRVVITVSGGCVQDVHCSDPATQVQLFDFDGFDTDEIDGEGRTKEEAEAAHDQAIAGLHAIL